MDRIISDYYMEEVPLGMGFKDMYSELSIQKSQVVDLFFL
jgi:hypothetical protein